AHTLLLADDSVTIQRVVALTFANEDINVIACGDSDRAMASLRQTRPDIVLADVSMAGQSGYDLARHIKTTPQLNGIPVILLTGALEAVDPARAAEVACDAVLTKPLEPSKVVEQVKQLLSIRTVEVTSEVVSIPPAAVRAPEPVVVEPA